MDNQDQFNREKYYQLYYRKTFLFAKSYVHDKYVAEDIASESLIKFWEAISKTEVRHPLTFLLSIVKNKSIDYLRHELIRQEAISAMSDTGLRELNTRISNLEACNPETIYSNEIEQIIQSTLRSLPEKTRQIFLMSRYRNMTKEEIASMMNITTKGVDYHISNALKSLRISLKDYLPIFCFLFLYQ